MSSQTLNHQSHNTNSTTNTLVPPSTDSTWQIMIESAPSEYAIFQGANEIVGISGCSINQARELMNNLPGILPKALYKHQA
ncbi:MAG: hypothetical protein F6K23_15555 [Okeania sp. SIO2C9]|uniref:hypothetical protein n=1 Tax=Okeania sp. SIO2C9 TaxID=2607791 RepID=UPI0013C0C8D9|nr:hypothetical protein [Okeania sp. SIO2C9]NEQ74329.1 hypothetical protein [Okeania sp. SIO2C9]